MGKNATIGNALIKGWWGVAERAPSVDAGQNEKIRENAQRWGGGREKRESNIIQRDHRLKKKKVNFE